MFNRTKQINRLERELGMKLLIRAWHERPMHLTDDGGTIGESGSGISVLEPRPETLRASTRGGG
jgi:hypothetical protein